MLIAQLLVGLALAMLGLLLVDDRLSLRALLAESGPEAAWRLVMDAHAALEHSGAQAMELAVGLLGLAIAGLSLRQLRRSSR